MIGSSFQIIVNLSRPGEISGMVYTNLPHLQIHQILLFAACRISQEH